MRILAGNLKGRTIHRPKTFATRPMSDKLRAALFNIIGDVSGMKVLDAYAGSGAIGFEALSHGAEKVVGIEASRPVAIAIRKTIQELDCNYTLEVAKVEEWVKRSEERFDVIVADPPYEKSDARVLGLLADHLGVNGLMVVSHSSRITSPEVKSVSLVDSRVYGDSTLSFYKR